MAAMNSLAKRGRSARGAELIEFALVFPLLLLLVLGMVDFGFLFQRYEVLTNAAREGARMAVLPGTYNNTDVRARVCSYIQSGGLAITGSCPTPTNPVITPSDTTVPLPGGATMQAKRVDITYTNTYLFIGPIARMFGGNFSTVPIRTVAIMRREVPAP
jgi:Flp pilus assembly protein TadG